MLKRNSAPAALKLTPAYFDVDTNYSVDDNHSALPTMREYTPVVKKAIGDMSRLRIKTGGFWRVGWGEMGMGMGVVEKDGEEKLDGEVAGEEVVGEDEEVVVKDEGYGSVSGSEVGVVEVGEDWEGRDGAYWV